nr:DUF3859 domain-containing protein [uncultured Glaciecola sp.]
MAKSNPIFKIESFGIYDGFNGAGKSLPKINQHTAVIPAEIDIEFGLTLSAKQAKGITLNWYIKHPNICDKKGREMAPFEGNVIVRNNDWRFYLGDTIWLPVDDKAGNWHMYIEYNNNVVAEQTFDVTLDDLESQNERMFWKSRGF